jgi:ABC-type antimicrobial peptide transport system permease subunit
MLSQLRFYFAHSLNDLRVNGQRTFFALLCIAAGVAAIVSLQTVTVMIGDTLTGNLQETNRGDIRVELLVSFGNQENEDVLAQGEAEGVLQSQSQSFFGRSNTTYSINPQGVSQIQAWLDENYPGQAQMTYKLDLTDPFGIFTSSGVGTTVIDLETGQDAASVTPVLIDPTIYPFYAEIRTEDGILLSEVLQSPTDIVINTEMAELLGVTLGDTLRVSGANTDFTLRGIVPTEAEVTDPATGVFLALFGFYYLHEDAIQYFETQGQINTLYLRIEDSARISEINNALLQRFGYFDTRTTQDLQRDNEELVEQLNQLVTIMGLVSLLIGSIGIVNTMQVIVRRRTIEIAVLKTMGLQGNQITILFLVEAFIMGIIGSLIGIVLGWGSTFLIKSVAETFVAQELPFRIALAPALNGFIVGVVVTTIFGFLPTLSAGQVRPGIVLRPNEDIIPRAGWLQTIGALVLIIVALALVAQTILGNFALAIAVVNGAFVAAGVIYALLLFLIWLIGRFFPSLGLVDLKISLRQMLVTRTRGASTLLALVVGVFSLSLITLFAESISNALNISLGNSGDVLVTAASEETLAQVEDTLSTQEGVTGYRTIRSYDGTLVSVEQEGTTYSLEDMRQRIEENSADERAQALAFGAPEDLDFTEAILSSLGAVNAYELDQMPAEVLVEGRLPTAEDVGRPVLVLRDNDNLRNAELGVGDLITMEFAPLSPIPGVSAAETQTVIFEVIGIVSNSLATSGFGSGAVFTSYEALPEGLSPSSAQVLVDIGNEDVPDLRRALSEIPGTFALETDVLNRLISSFLSTFTAFPTLVAALGLIVGGVVIANSVALSTMERRREIAVMKSIGLQRERVLAMLLLENGIMGLIGGLIGVGIGLVGLVILTTASSGTTEAIPYGTALLLMLLCIGVALIATLSSAWSASGEKPLNVLRYE